jgi:glycerol-3-phosphate dehydrogenase subunit C
LAGAAAPVVNWAGDRKNRLTRPLLEKVAGIDRNAALPKYHGRTFVMRSKSSAPPVDSTAPACGRKAVLYATCLAITTIPASARRPAPFSPATASKPR